MFFDSMAKSPHPVELGLKAAMKYTENVASNLKKYLRPDQPFGPPDASNIEEPECAAALYDWNNDAFAELLTGSDVLVGRRGAGKSSLLLTFKSKQFLNEDFEKQRTEARAFRNRHHIASKTLTAVPDIIVDVCLPKHIYDLELFCTNEMVLPPVEILAEKWTRRIWWLVGKEIQNISKYWSELPNHVKKYISNDDISSQLDSTQATSQTLTPQQYIKELESFLKERQLKVIVTIDNVEQHEFTPVHNRVLV